MVKIALLKIPKNKFSVIPEKIIGIFVWENDEWILTAPKAIKRKIDRDVSEFYSEYCNKGKNTITRKVKMFNRKDYDFIKHVNDVLLWELKERYAVGDIESMTAKEVERFKEVIALL